MFKEMADAFSQIEDSNVLTDKLADCLKEPSRPLTEFQIIWALFSVLLIVNTLVSPWVLRLRSLRPKSTSSRAAANKLASNVHQNGTWERLSEANESISPTVI